MNFLYDDTVHVLQNTIDSRINSAIVSLHTPLYTQKETQFLQEYSVISLSDVLLVKKDSILAVHLSVFKLYRHRSSKQLSN